MKLCFPYLILCHLIHPCIPLSTHIPLSTVLATLWVIASYYQDSLLPIIVTPSSSRPPYPSPYINTQISISFFPTTLFSIDLTIGLQFFNINSHVNTAILPHHVNTAILGCK